jgi:hypothetical protein
MTIDELKKDAIWALESTLEWVAEEQGIEATVNNKYELWQDDNAIEFLGEKVYLTLFGGYGMNKDELKGTIKNIKKQGDFIYYDYDFNDGSIENMMNIIQAWVLEYITGCNEAIEKAFTIKWE